MQCRCRWIGGDAWVVNELIHTGGRWAIRALVGYRAGLLDRDLCRARLARAAAAGCILHRSRRCSRSAWSACSRPLTNVDCPWDLVPFGGRFPYVELFADRPDCAPRIGRCFPAAHASSGYALLALYFVVSRATRDAGEAGPWIGTVGRTDIRRGAAVTRRALRLARPVERVPRLDGHALDSMHSPSARGCGNRRNHERGACLVGWLLDLHPAGRSERSAQELRGRRVSEVLDELRSAGLTFIYNTQIVPRDLRVETEPARTRGRRAGARNSRSARPRVVASRSGRLRRRSGLPGTQNRSRR